MPDRLHSRSALSFRKAVWLFPVALALHELEEWNILDWYLEHWLEVDPHTMTPASVHVWLIFASVLGFLGTFAAVNAKNFELMVRLFLLPSFVVAVFGHALAHIYWTWLFAGYSPGVITSVFLVIPATLYLLVRARREGIISSRYLFASLSAATLPVALAVRTGNVVPSGGVPWLRFSTWILGEHEMVWVALTLSLFLAAAGAMGIVAPSQFVALIRRIQTPAGLCAATVFRIVLGVALFNAAPASRAPELVRVIGVVSIATGVATPIFGLGRFRRLLDRVSAPGPAAVQVWAAIGLGLGLLLAYSVFP